VTVEVTDLADPALADYRNLTDVELRRRLEPAGGLFIAEGEMVIRRALDAGVRPRSILTEARWLDRLADVVREVERTDAPVFVADPAILRSVTGYRVHRGALAAMHRPALPEPSSLLQHANRVVALVDMVDHANVGAVFRSAAGLGVDAVAVSAGCADPLYRRAVKVSMGAVLTQPWTRLPDGDVAKTLRENGLTVAALTPAADALDLAELSRDVPERLALMLGTEGDGLSAAAANSADVRVRIPMAPGVDSLNVAAASAVACWALWGSGGRARG
jgi:tRNA G18 (ribose-2'-O)-methylase SpoU